MTDLAHFDSQGSENQADDNPSDPSMVIVIGLSAFFGGVFGAAIALAAVGFFG